MTQPPHVVQQSLSQIRAHPFPFTWPTPSLRWTAIGTLQQAFHRALRVTAGVTAVLLWLTGIAILVAELVTSWAELALMFEQSSAGPIGEFLLLLE